MIASVLLYASYRSKLFMFSLFVFSIPQFLFSKQGHMFLKKLNHESTESFDKKFTSQCEERERV